MIINYNRRHISYRYKLRIK